MISAPLAVTYFIELQDPLLFTESPPLIVEVDKTFLSLHGLTEVNLQDIGISLPAKVSIDFGHIEPPSDAAWARSDPPEGIPIHGDVTPRRWAACTMDIQSRDAVYTSVQPVSAFTFCWWALAEALRALRIVANAPIRAFSFHSHQQFINYLVHITQANGVIENVFGMFVLPERSYAAPPQNLTVTGEDILMSEIVVRQLIGGEPSYLILNQIMEAKIQRFVNASESAAVLHYAVACELAFDCVLAAALWELGIAPITAVARWQNVGLARRIASDYAPMLGGLWGQGQGGPIDKWRLNVARLRGRIIHAGYQPSKAEVDLASDTTNELLDYIVSLLAVKATSFPKTLLLLSSPESAVRVTRGKARQAVEAMIPRMEMEVEGYRTWQGELLSLRLRSGQ